RAVAALHGRAFVLPDDVQAVARPVLTHRIQPAGTGSPGTQAEVVEDVLSRVRAR
ncbi:MAG TPA: ATPase, partial [Thermomonospora sp.]|nr:ATPase [Thermomonospora sp.]